MQSGEMMEAGKQLDMLEDSADTALAMIEAGNIEAVKEIILGLKPLITEEKRKIAGDQKTRYDYVCKECFLKCKANLMFEPKENYLTYCRLNGGAGAKYKQVEKKTEIN